MAHPLLNPLWKRFFPEEKDIFLCDFHTHYPSRKGELVLQDGIDSWGIHPWKATTEDFIIPDSTSFRAIGECGLDKLCQTPYDMQLKIFRKHITLSEDCRLPLIIHCVKAIDDILQLHREYAPQQPWIMHGFRGKPQQMESLLNHGFYISFGFRYNRESLIACPLSHLLLETDNDPRPVSLLYEEVATLRGI